jgi:predicted signal transduction protein with EAL and GGDEF domain
MASLGVAPFSEGAATSDELVRGARDAFLAAKEAGKNRAALWAGPGVGCRRQRQVRAT